MSQPNFRSFVHFSLQRVITAVFFLFRLLSLRVASQEAVDYNVKSWFRCALICQPSIQKHLNVEFFSRLDLRRNHSRGGGGHSRRYWTPDRSGTRTNNSTFFGFFFKQRNGNDDLNVTYYFVLLNIYFWKNEILVFHQRDEIYFVSRLR